MTNHLTDEQMLAILHGALAGGARDEAKRHLGSCERCTEALARDAALDEVLWAAREAQGSPLPHTAPVAAPARAAVTSPSVVSARRQPARRSRRVRWVAGGAFGAAATALLAYAGNAGGLSEHTTVSGVNVLLAWQSIIFYIPLAVGILLVIGWAMGGLHHHDADAGADGAHDAGHDHEHDASTHHDVEGLVDKALSVLGVGRVPLTLILMIASLYFGGIGLILNMALSALRLPAVIYGSISIVMSLVATFWLTGSTARLLHRVMPTTETYLVSRHSFAGCTGKLLFAADATSGYAQVKDREGNVHNIKCRTNGGTLDKGTEILVVEYDEEAKVFVVDASQV